MVASGYLTLRLGHSRLGDGNVRHLAIVVLGSAVLCGYGCGTAPSAPEGPSVAEAAAVREQAGSDSQALVRKALQIIGEQLEIGENLRIRGSGKQGPVMDAAQLLKRASSLEPANLQLRYAYICALRLTGDFESAEQALVELTRSHPEFALGRFTLEGWQDDKDGVAPAVFRYPEWTPDKNALCPFYQRAVKTFVLLPAREGIRPRAMLALRDAESYWTRAEMRHAKVEIAVVCDPASPSVSAVYARFLLPGRKPDIHESLAVLGLPKADSVIAAWSYLCLADSVDVVVVDNRSQVIFSQRVPLSEHTKQTLAEVRERLLRTKGRKLSPGEVLAACGKYQNSVTIDEIERKYFPR